MAMATATVKEIEGIETSKIEDFPLSALRVVGSIQVGLGGICIVFGLVDILLYVFDDDSVILPTASSGAANEAAKTLTSLTICSAPIWCGLWFCVAGAMAACMSDRSKVTLSYFKNTFMVLSVLNAIIFGPVCLIITAVLAVMRHDLEASTYRWMIPILTSFFSLNEIIVAILSAAICCCCAALRTSQVRVLLAMQRESSKVHPETEKAPIDDKPQKNQKRQNKKNEMIYEEKETERYPVHHQNNLRRPVEKPNDVSEDPFSSGEQDTNGPPARDRDRPFTKGSMTSFARLKRLALPSNEPLSTF